MQKALDFNFAREFRTLNSSFPNKPTHNATNNPTGYRGTPNRIPGPYNPNHRSCHKCRVWFDISKCQHCQCYTNKKLAEYYPYEHREPNWDYEHVHDA